MFIASKSAFSEKRRFNQISVSFHFWNKATVPALEQIQHRQPRSERLRVSAGGADTLPATSSMLQIGNDALYLYCTDGINQCLIANLLVSKKWRLITGRNLATVQKILAML